MIQFNIERDIVDKNRGPDLMPLIDMVFILLIFFLLTSAAVQPSVDFDLPETSAGNPTTPPSLLVTIRADGALLIDEDPVPEELFQSTFESRYRGQSGLTIQADRRVAFGRVVEIMDLCREAGAEEISFLVQMEEEE